MLLRRDDDGVVVIGQPAHAWVSGELARTWGNERFGAVEPREEVCLGAEQHDVGMTESDLAPRLNPQTGLPRSFMELDTGEHLAMWSRAPSLMLPQSRYAALLVSLHGSALYARRDLSRLPEADAARVREFLAGQERLQQELVASLGADPAQVARNQRLVWTWDALSLCLLLGWAPYELKAVPAAGGDVDVDVRAGEDGTITLEPWPFAADRVTLRCEGRRLAGTFAGEDEMRAALAAAPWEEIEVVLATPSAQRASTELRRLTNGYQVSQAIHVAATLGIADLLDGGPRGSDELAAAAGADPDALYRLLRALASVGVLHEDEGRRFSLTAVGDGLRSGAQAPVGGWAAMIGRPYYWRAWGELLHSVRTGENAFRHLHGTDPWTYRAGMPEEAAIFDRAMADLTRRSHASVLRAYDFSGFGTVVDVGGGNGAFLAHLLAAHPRMRGVLLDLPHAVAASAAVFEAAGVGGRAEAVAGDFFAEVPSGGDAYVLRAVLHDWEDEQCAAILASVRRAMPDDAALVIIERDLGPANSLPDAKLSDLNMLVAPGGRERTVAEYGGLVARAGLALQESREAGYGLHVMVSRPA